MKAGEAPLKVEFDKSSFSIFLLGLGNPSAQRRVRLGAHCAAGAKCASRPQAELGLG